MNNPKICVITGCAGFIGSHLTEKCLDMGWYVYGIDKLSYCSYPKLMEEFKNKYPNNFKFEHIDINNVKYIPDVDIIFNICAESHVDNSIEKSDEFIRSNINGVHNLLEIIRHKKIRPLFYQMSTDEIYGDCLENQSHTENDNYNPSNPYSFSKASADLLIKSYSRTYDIEFKIGRSTNTYGIRQNTEKLIPRTCRNLLLNRKTPLHNYGTPKRIWLHVMDCVDGILTIIEKGEINEIYNISGKEEYKNWEIVSKISSIIHGPNDYFVKIFHSPIDYAYYESNNIKITHTPSGSLAPNIIVRSSIGKDNIHIEQIDELLKLKTNMNTICDFSYHRDGQDVRYSLDDNKLRTLGWKPIYELDKELPSVVKYYQENFVW